MQILIAAFNQELKDQVLNYSLLRWKWRRSVNVDALLLLQQELRYGVNTRTAVSICEKVFNDRVIAIKLTALIGNNGISSEDIFSTIRAKKAEAIELVSCYPSYFRSIIDNL